jgi:hypothetical protein
MQPDPNTPPAAASVQRSPPERYRFKKGQSGNPGGRPKGRSLTAALRELVQQEHNGRQILDLIAERIVREALSGKYPFAREVLERLDGRTTERVEVENRSWLDQVSDEEFVRLAVKHNRIDLLPARLRERAAALLPDAP